MKYGLKRRHKFLLSADEEKLLIEGVQKHGKDFDRLHELIPNKPKDQMCNYVASLKHFLIKNPDHPLNSLKQIFDRHPRRWSEDEEKKFIDGFELHGNNW